VCRLKGIHAIYYISSPISEAVANKLILKVYYNPKSIKATSVLQVKERLVKRDTAAINPKLTIREDKSLYNFLLLI